VTSAGAGAGQVRPHPSQRPLLKILGVAFGLAVIIGNTIGAGILRTPGDVAAALPNPWLFVGVWIVGALYALLGVNALAELGTMLPRSGGQYVFARHTFGDFAGFVVGWNDWISTCASVAAISIVVGESLAELIAPLRTHGVALAMGTVVVFTFLLWHGTRLGDRAQQITSLSKAVALLALVAICFALGGGAQHDTVRLVPRSASVFVGFVLAAQSVIYTYDGWSGPLYFSEELHDPGREIPRSMFGGLLCIAAIYILINVAFLRVVPVGRLAGSPLAAATVARALFGARGDTVVRLVVVVALPSAVNACLLMASRVLFGVSRDGLGMRIARRVNEGGTPTIALLMSAVVAIVFLATGTFQTVIAIAAFFFVLNYALSFLAVFVLRRREPDATRPYRAVGHPWTTGIVLAGSAAFLASAVAGDTRNSMYSLMVLLASYPVYRLMRRRALSRGSSV
jgi:APA family basic amino acid/polyamine antiporter